MKYQGGSYQEHTAIFVKDILWHINFFEEAFGMPVRYSVGAPGHPDQVWLLGGIQIIEDKGFDQPEGRLAHLGIMTSDPAQCLDAAYERGAVQVPGKERNWFRLPEGLCIEVMQAGEGAVERFRDSVNLMGSREPKTT